MVSLAQEINDRMPSYVIQRCATLLNEHGKSVRGARVLLLGVTYKPDSADQEAAPAREIATRLMDMGAQIGYHDPHVLDWRVRELPVPRADSLYEAAAAADLTVLLQQHRTYDLQGLAVKAQLLLDTRGPLRRGRHTGSDAAYRPPRLLVTDSGAYCYRAASQSAHVFASRTAPAHFAPGGDPA